MWLNDIVMDIQLRSVHDELRPHSRRKSLIYPVHFYSKLKNSGYTDVIRWTKHEDIFRKDYLLIVENAFGNHWRLMIVCFPGNEEGEYIKTGRKMVEKRPCILMLDSKPAQVSDSMEVFQNIRSYLTGMWKNTQKKPRTFSAASMPALKVRVPKQQGNCSECGIFVLLCAEHFLNDPPKELINELDCTTWFTLADAFSRRAQIRDKMRRCLEARERDTEEIIAEEREGEKQQNIFERGREAEEDEAGESEKQQNIFERGREAEKNKAEESEKQENIFERVREAQENEAEESEEEWQVENITKESEIECREKENKHTTREENKTAQGRSYTVLGRLSVPGTKRKYTVTQDEIKRRIITENMSNNMLRSLIRVRKEDLPEELRLQRPKKLRQK
ncbi:sentrin-specific protease 7 [Misgurnus anguillicaudatus]|uniref:sentrin-specific protease 7 n=1 Tax=Misgurnus anguillicaudatus TaxID=75329 RepID=UPI002435B170|nr:sentrin-specific protease 7-like [Misgurnus anguillicaudatus]